jgi:transposase
MPQLNDLSRSLVALAQDSTIIAVVELSQSSWLVAGVLPGIERQPQKKLEPSAERLLGLLHCWRVEAVRAGKEITRIALAFETGRDGFWLARWLNARGVEAHVMPQRQQPPAVRAPAVAAPGSPSVPQYVD